MPLSSGQRISGAVAPGWVGESTRNTSSGTITTTETVVQSVTFTATPGARYKITAVQSVQSSVAADLIQVQVRWSSGATLSISGAQLASLLVNQDVAGKGIIVPLVITVAGLSGQVTVGVTVVRASGTGNVTSFGNAQQINTVLVERV